MADQVKKDLINLAKKLGTATFGGIATGKYYPANSRKAYYRMKYSPKCMILRHKSPGSPIEEKFEITYQDIDDYNCAAVSVYLDDKLLWTCSSEKELGEKLEEKIFGGINKFLIGYLFKDPRVIFSAAENWEEIPPDTFDKAYKIGAFNASFNPIIGISVIAELFLKNDSLKMMKLRHFLLRKEIASQTMSIKFQFDPNS